MKAHRQLHAFSRAQEAVAVNQILVSRRDVDLHDLARNLGRERNQAVRTCHAVFGHKNTAARKRAAQHAEHALRSGGHRRRVELHVGGHPRKLTGFRDDLVAGFKTDL